MTQEFFDVHHVSFDMWLTLIRSRPQFRQKRDELFRELFGLKAGLEEISQQFKKWDQRFTVINEKTGQNLDAEEMLSIVLMDMDHPPEKFNGGQIEEFFARQEELFFSLHPEPIEQELPAYLSRLKSRGINLSILSNTGFIKGRLLRKLMDKLELSELFSFQLYSDEIACSKPSEKAFFLLYHEAVKARRTEKENILHIGDNPNADVYGASSAGMKAAQINSNSISLLHLNIYRESALK